MHRAGFVHNEVNLSKFHLCHNVELPQEFYKDDGFKDLIVSLIDFGKVTYFIDMDSGKYKPPESGFRQSRSNPLFSSLN